MAGGVCLQRAEHSRDQQSTKYIERYADRVPASVCPQAGRAGGACVLRHPHPVESAELTGPYAPLMKAVEKGLKGDACRPDQGTCWPKSSRWKWWTKR